MSEKLRAAIKNRSEQINRFREKLKRAQKHHDSRTAAALSNTIDYLLRQNESDELVLNELGDNQQLERLRKSATSILQARKQVVVTG